MDHEQMSILVGIDFSAASERALTQAVELAERLPARLQVVHIHEMLPTVPAADMLGVMPNYGTLDERYEEERVQRRNRCSELCERVISDRVRYGIYLVDAPAVAGLLGAIATLKPNLVIVGTHGRGALKRWLLGSVSTELCRRSPVPVLVVPPAERAQAASGLDADTGRDQAPGSATTLGSISATLL
jgi:nucleotide-binding universal stress UspA family protein